MIMYLIRELQSTQSNSAQIRVRNIKSKRRTKNWISFFLVLPTIGVMYQYFFCWDLICLLVFWRFQSYLMPVVSLGPATLISSVPWVSRPPSHLGACTDTTPFAGVLHHHLPNATHSLNLNLIINRLKICSWSSASQTRPHVLPLRILHFFTALILVVWCVPHTHHAHTCTRTHTHTHYIVIYKKDITYSWCNLIPGT